MVRFSMVTLLPVSEPMRMPPWIIVPVVPVMVSGLSIITFPLYVPVPSVTVPPAGVFPTSSPKLPATVVKLQVYADASGFPTASVITVLRVAVYVVPILKLALGVKVAI